MTAKDPYQILSAIYDLLLAPVIGLIHVQEGALYPPKPDESVLDVGCGTGAELAIYQKAGSQITGVDLSPAMLAKARRRLGRSANLRLESATALSFPDGCFDLVTLILVLHEMAPHIRATVLKECTRVIKQDGHLLVVDYHTGPFPFPQGWIYRAFALVMEVIAGPEHLANYHDFMAHQGLVPLFANQQLTIERQIIPAHGVMAYYLLAKKIA